MLWVLICIRHSYFPFYLFQRTNNLFLWLKNSNLHNFADDNTIAVPCTNICLNVKELPARNKRDIWSLSDCNGIRTHNHLVRKRTLNHLAKLAKWFGCVEITYLYGALDCAFLSCHIRMLEWIYTLQLPQCQGTSCSKQALYLKFKWLQIFSYFFDSTQKLFNRKKILSWNISFQYY